MTYTDAIIDLSHHNGNVNLIQASNNGVVGVIQKATQGTHYVDPTYTTNCEKAQKVELLWGAYHFGTGGDGIAQAEYFLQTVSL